MDMAAASSADSWQHAILPPPPRPSHSPRSLLQQPPAGHHAWASMMLCGPGIGLAQPHHAAQQQQGRAHACGCTLQPLSGHPHPGAPGPKCSTVTHTHTRQVHPLLPLPHTPHPLHSLTLGQWPARAVLQLHMPKQHAGGVCAAMDRFCKAPVSGKQHAQGQPWAWLSLMLCMGLRWSGIPGHDWATLPSTAPGCASGHTTSAWVCALGTHILQHCRCSCPAMGTCAISTHTLALHTCTYTQLFPPSVAVNHTCITHAITHKCLATLPLAVLLVSSCGA
jgi:hypothetical protein